MYCPTGCRKVINICLLQAIKSYVRGQSPRETVVGKQILIIYLSPYNQGSKLFIIYQINPMINILANDKMCDIH